MRTTRPMRERTERRALKLRKQDARQAREWKRRLAANGSE